MRVQDGAVAYSLGNKAPRSRDRSAKSRVSPETVGPPEKISPSHQAWRTLIPGADHAQPHPRHRPVGHRRLQRRYREEGSSSHCSPEGRDRRDQVGGAQVRYDEGVVGLQGRGAPEPAGADPARSDARRPPRPAQDQDAGRPHVRRLPVRGHNMRNTILRAGLLLGLSTIPAAAVAQKALVYCPTADQSGCNAIVTALSTAYPDGVDKGYDGTGGTLDLRTLDHSVYSVFVVPSLADDSNTQPYALLRDPAVVEHLKTALIGGIAVWSGFPDQGTANRESKDQLIRNLAQWAGKDYATAKGPGLVALLDLSEVEGARYDWLRAITPLQITSDVTFTTYDSVRTLTATGAAISGSLSFGSMAALGVATPTPTPGLRLDALGATGTSVGGQVVLATLAAGNTSTAKISTDKLDYSPGTPVTITGSGWAPGEMVTITLHEDPLLEQDSSWVAVADGFGNFTSAVFAPDMLDIGTRFVLTADGGTSGMRAQATFTDGAKFWVGCASTDWGSGASPNNNWSTSSSATCVGGVPSSGNVAPPTVADPATILAGKPNYPVLSTGSFAAQVITINSGASLTISGGSLATAASGQDLTNEGTLTISNGTLTIGRDFLGSGTTAMSGGTLKVGRDFRLTSTGVNNWSQTGGTVEFTTIAAGDAGQFTGVGVAGIHFYNLAVSGANDAKLNTGSETIQIKGDLTYTNTKAGAGDIGGTTIFNGSGSQTIAGNQTVPFNNLTSQNAGGLTASTNVNVDAALVLTSGNITMTGGSVIIVGADATTGSVTGGYVIGKLQKFINNNAAQSTKKFEVGTGTFYTPLTITPLANPSGTGATSALIVTSIAGEHPNVGTSSLNSAKDVNSYWSVTGTGAGSMAAAGYTVKGEFVAGDLAAGANTGSFILERFLSPNWTELSSPVLTSTSTEATQTFGTATAITSAFGDFAIGESNRVAPTVTFTGAPASAPYQGTFTVASTTNSSATPVYSSSGGCSNIGTVYTMTSPTTTCTSTVTWAADASYFGATLSQTTLAVKATQAALTVTGPASVTYGTTGTATASGGSGTGALTFDAGVSSGCSVSGTTVSVSDASGTCNLTATKAADANYAAATSAPFPVTLVKKSQAITFADPANRPYGDPDFTVTATSNSGLAVSFSTASAACTVTTGGLVHIVAAGTCTIAADQAGDNNYKAAPQVTQSFTIAKANQTITFPDPADRFYGDPDFTVTATSTSGLAVTFSTTSAACTVTTGGLVHIVAVGNCAIAANQAGNTNYNAAPQVSMTFAVAKGSQTITFGTLADKTFGDADFAVSATASSGLAVSFSSTTTAVCTVSGSTVHIVASGTCTIAADQAGNTNYLAAPQVTQSFTVAKANQATLTVTAPSAVTYGTTGTATTSGGSGTGALTFISGGSTGCSVSGTTVSVNDVSGSCTLTATKAADNGYNSATSAPFTVTLNKATQATLTVTGPVSVSYGTTGTATSSGGSGTGLLSFDGGASTACTVSGTTVSLSSATGTCVLTVTKAADNNYNAATSAPFTVTLNKATPTVTFTGAPASAAYQSTFTVASTTNSSAAPVYTATGGCTNGGTTTYTMTSGSTTCTSTVTWAADANYLTATRSQTTTASKIAPTGTFTGAPASAAYLSSFTVASTSNSSDVPSYTHSGGCSNSGTTYTMTSGTTSCVATVTWMADANYLGAVLTQTTTAVKIDQATLTVTGPASAPYGTTSTATASGGSSTGALSFSTGTSTGCSVSGTAVSVNDLNGTCSLTATKAADANYTAATSAPFPVALIKGSQTINFSNLGNMTYGDADFTANATASSGLTVSFTSTTTAVCTVSGSTVHIVTAGTCTIAADQAGDNNYNAAPQVLKSSTISKANQTITFPDPADRPLSSPDFTVTATSTSGLAVSFSTTTTTVCTVTTDGTVHLVAIGMCSIKANQAGDGNYNAAGQKMMSFTVTQGIQTITFTSTAPSTASVGGPTYTVTATGGGSGNPVTFTSSTPAVCSLSGSTVSFVAVGTCTIAANQAGNTNWLAAPQATQSFGVAKGNQAITFGALANKTFLDPDFAVSATSSSGLAVTFSSTTAPVCTVSGTTVHIVEAGTCTIAADQAGNTNYNAAPQVTQSLTVAKATQATLTVTAPSAVTYGTTGTATATGGSGTGVVTFRARSAPARS